MRAIKPRRNVEATVRLPGSKSITHRALIAAALAEGESILEGFLECEDTLCTIRALRELGIKVLGLGDRVSVTGMGGSFSPQHGERKISVGNSGTSYRLLLSAIALSRGDYVLTGSPRMEERPIGELVNALKKLGAGISCTSREGFPPVRLRSKGMRGGKVEIDGNESSQYVSSILLAAPYSESDVEIVVNGQLVSSPYVDLTIHVMEKFGVCVLRAGHSYFEIEADQRYRPCRFAIEGDITSASYFWAAAAVTGGTVTTRNINSCTRQGDMKFLKVLENMGCHVRRGRREITVHGGSLRGVDVDMSAMPDLVPTLAAIAPFADGKTSVRNVPHLRHKESDRLKAIAQEWGRLGSRVEERPDGLIIHGDGGLSGTVVNPHDDHRIAMSLAVMGLRVPGINISNERCVDKSFPGFWEMWERL